MEQKQNIRIEEKLARAFEAQTPDRLDAILEDCQMKKGKGIQMKKTFVRRLTAIAAAFAILLGAVFAVQLLGNTALTTVAIDVNPSIELNLDKNEKIVSATALNSDAEKILYGLELENKTLEDAVSLIVSSMIEKGFISEISNSILVSVDGDGEKNAALRDKIASMINSILENGKISGSVLSQTHVPDSTVKALAEKYNISTGKAALIADIVAADGTHLFEEFVSLSVNELNILLEKLENASVAVNKNGNASRVAYVDKETAIASALADLGVTEVDAEVREVELDYEHGMMVYEIELRFDGKEYDYEIDAISGQIVRVEADNDKHSSINSTPPAGLITEAEAKKAALEDASVSADDVLSFHTELDFDDGFYYDVDFKTANAKYEYEVDAESGKILDKEIKFLSVSENKGENTSDPLLTVTKEDAIGVALKHAGVSDNDAKGLEAELDREHGVAVYDVEFKAGGYEYEYKISAEDLSILHSEKDRD